MSENSPSGREWRMTSVTGLHLEITDGGGTAVFARFFAGFDKAFVLPNEKEDIEGFRTCLALNHGGAYRRLSARYGAYREVVLMAHAGDTDIGGANFIAIPFDKDTVTANLNYVFVAPEARGRGYLGKICTAVRECVADMFALTSSAQVLIFIEQNDPFRMTAEDYRHDSDFTGLDQFDRLRIWTKLGALAVDFPYQQPPLSVDQDADDTLLYSVLGATGNTLDSCILENHLRSFFGVSVLKGAELTSNAAASELVERLRNPCTEGARISLIDATRLLSRIASREQGFNLWPNPPATFREALQRPLPPL